METKNLGAFREAYYNIYVSEENKIQEWANSLIEEGHDLTDYTSDELYEAYIEERSRKGLNPEARAERAAQQNVARAQAPTAPATGGGRRGLAQRRAAKADTGAGGDAAYRSGGGDAAARTGLTRQQIQQQGMQNVRNAPTQTPAATPASRPAAPQPAARPAAPQPAARPAAPTPVPTSAARPTAPAGQTRGTGQSQMSRQAADIRAMRQRSLERQGRPLAAASVAASQPPAFQSNSFDVFDLIKGYLLDEGYADTEEGAMVMMVNMSDEWRGDILEFLGGKPGDGFIGHPRLGIRNPLAPRNPSPTAAAKPTASPSPTTTPQRNTGGLAARLGNRANQTDAAIRQLRNSYELGEASPLVALAPLAGKLAGGAVAKGVGSKLAGKAAAGSLRSRAAQSLGNKAGDMASNIVRDRMKKPSKDELKKNYGSSILNMIKSPRSTNEEAKLELEAWVDELIAEGYDLSEYTWEEVAEIYVEELQLEAKMELSREKRNKMFRRAGNLSREALKGGDEGTEALKKSSKIVKALNKDDEEHNRNDVKESQEARNNPEKYESGERKKYAPVRGEKTPMPPRGDKRREEFEKWYAKQMGR